MLTLVFGLIATLWGALSFYFAWRFFLRRRVQSLVISLAMLSPVVHVARELKWLPRLPTSLFLAAALSIGLLGVAVVAHHEMQRPRPFL